METLEVPGKLFLIGEYGVVDGGPALVCALRPGYRFRSGGSSPVHPDSPAGVFLAEEGANPSAGIPARISDGSRAGFGSSTAELIAAYRFVRGRMPALSDLWPWYRSRFPRQSGADLATQISALGSGWPLFRVTDGSRAEPHPVSKEVLARIRVYCVPPSAKQKTHEDLRVPREPLAPARCASPIERVSGAIAGRDPAGLAAFDDFADVLAQSGRESGFSGEVRRSFRALPGVIGVKGSGAALHDAYLVAHRDGEGIPESLDHAGERMGLHPLGTLGELLW